jgi:hypothetical protein
VVFSHTLVRFWADWLTDRWDFRGWRRESADRLPRGRGIVVGWRWLQSGVLDIPERAARLAPKRVHRAYLVAFDVRRKPVLVLTDDTAQGET